MNDMLPLRCPVQDEGSPASGGKYAASAFGLAGFMAPLGDVKAIIDAGGGVMALRSKEVGRVWVRRGAGRSDEPTG